MNKSIYYILTLTLISTLLASVYADESVGTEPPAEEAAPANDTADSGVLLHGGNVCLTVGACVLILVSLFA